MERENSTPMIISGPKREREREREDEGNCIIRTIIISTFHRI
jgi:hypothetical protein